MEQGTQNGLLGKDGAVVAGDEGAHLVGDELVDLPLILLFVEHAVEFHVHGGTWTPNLQCPILRTIRPYLLCGIIWRTFTGSTKESICSYYRNGRTRITNRILDLSDDNDGEASFLLQDFARRC